MICGLAIPEEPGPSHLVASVVQCLFSQAHFSLRGPLSNVFLTYHLRSVHEMMCVDATATEYGGRGAAFPVLVRGRATSQRLLAPPSILAVLLSPSPTFICVRRSLALFKDVDCEWRLNDLGFLLSSVLC